MGELLKVNMFGRFSIQYNGVEVVLDRNITSKVTLLFQVIALHAEEGVSKASLIDMLYGREEVENPNATLNNTLFRLRKRLKSLGLPTSSYVLINGGICKWDNSIPIELDCSIFEDLINEGRRQQDKDKRIEYYEAACGMYFGEFLPDQIGEDWVSVNNHYYGELYKTCLEEVCHYLFEMERYDELYKCASEAAQIYPFESWQIWMIDSLIGMGRYSEGIEVYRNTEKLYFQELNLPPTSEMLERFEYMGERISNSTKSISDIQGGLREQNEKNGAYYCAFPSFIDAYRVVERLTERNGMSVYLMLCTLRNAGGRLLEKRPRDLEVTKAFRDSICKSIRKGDFYTRYNNAQYLILMTGLNEEHCELVSKRIDSAFHELIPYGIHHVDYYVASVEEIYSVIGA
ncbi:MAG: hypothetical protein HUJ72_10645 [Blautia sp.]|nr:hypothetical protein [Blautia sp.]